MAARLALVRLALCALAIQLLSACGVGYIVQQSYGQIAMLSARQPIAAVLREPGVSPELRDRLVLAWYAREYARTVIGLRTRASYRDVVRLRRDAASYVVAAAPPDSLEPYRWCFPVAGCLPYIGYFNRDDAVRERARLEARGYDVYLRGVDAYSLGGWLPDPLYSPLLRQSRARVADTVIHELTHGTVFLPGRARFNESLATFVGNHGSLAFLERRYGPGSRTVAEARDELADQALYNDFLEGVTRELRAVYAAPVSRAEKLRRHDEVLARAREREASLPFRSTRGHRLRRRALNNAVIATYAVYFGAQEPFEAVYRRLGCDLARFVRFVHDRVAHERDPEGFMLAWARGEVR